MCRIKDCPAILVMQPEPRAAAEAHAVAIVLTVTASQFETETENIAFRYFTLECGVDILARRCTVLCEWEAESRLNYGPGPEPDLAQFAAAVAARL